MAINQFGNKTPFYGTYNVTSPQTRESTPESIINGRSYGTRSKINDTLNKIQAGARNNKYRIFYDTLGEDFDIMVHSTSMPGREVSSTEVFVRGRKYKLAGEISDDGTWEATFYNDPDLLHRRFFLKMLDGIHNFNTPDYLLSGGERTESSLTGPDYFYSSDTLTVGDFLGKINDTAKKINDLYYSVKALKTKVSRSVDYITKAINGDWDAIASIFSENNYQKPWYMQEIVIQQLDHEGRIVYSATLHNAFVTNVSPLEYQDEQGEISTTTVTFEYSGITFT